MPPPPAEETLGVAWPLFGYDPERHRVGPSELKPPFRRVWTFRARQLLEFPPVIGYGRLYFTNNSGVMFAVNAKTGKRAWKKPIGRCVAASPAVGEHTVYQSFLNRPPCNSKAKPGRLEGEVIAFATGFGKIRWRTRIGPTESSPLARRRPRLRRRLARPRLRARRADGPRALDVPGQGPDQGRGREVGQPALRRHLRRPPLRVRAQHREGDLADALAGPARRPRPVLLDARGRVRARLHRLDRRQGLLVRRGERQAALVAGRPAATSTRSPAVWRKTVYVGSYSGRFYALDAATGDVKWRFQAKGDISGSATVARTASSTSRPSTSRTYALDARTGKLLWTFPDGKYAGVVADSRTPLPRRPRARLWDGRAVRYVVTGAAGFIGSHLAETLLARRARGRRASTRSPTTTTRARKERNAAALDVLELDLAEAPLEPILAGADGVFHLAGQPGVRASLGETLRALPARGTCSRRSGSSRRRRPRTSASSSRRPRPSTATPSATRRRRTWRRGRSRRTGSRSSPASSSRTRSARGQGLDAVVLRYFTVYGPRQRPDMAFTAMLEALAARRPFRLFGDGSAARSFTYVGDAVAATIAAMERGRGGEVYNVGGGDEATMNEAIALAEADRRTAARRRADEPPRPATSGGRRPTWRRRRPTSAGRRRPALEEGMRAQWRWAAVESPA